MLSPSTRESGPGRVAARPAGRSRARTRVDDLRVADGDQLVLAAVMRDHLGQVQRAQGRLDAAIGTLRAGPGITAPPGGRPPPAAGPAYVGLAEVAYQRNELDSAPCGTSPKASRYAASSSIPRRWPRAWLPWPGSGRPTAIRRGAGSDGTGRTGRAGPGVTVLLNPVPAQRARLMLAQGNQAAAAQLGAAARPRRRRRAGLLAGAGASAAGPGLLAQDRPGPALALLGRLHAAAAAQRRAGSIIEIEALRALALAAAGEESAAVGVLAEALTLACPHRLCPGVRR